MGRLFRFTLVLCGLMLLSSTAAVASYRDATQPTWLYFTSDSALYRMYPDGSHLELLMDEVKMFGGTWSPDNQWLVFSGSHDYGFADLYRFNVYTRRLELIAATDLSDGFVEWTPDDQYMVFKADSEEYYKGYYLMRPNGSEQRELLADVRLPNYVQLSPDGEWVLYYTGWEQVNHIYLEKIDGTETRQLTDFSTGSQLWRTTADDEWILFTTSDADQSDIYRMRWDGSEKLNITHDIHDGIGGHILSPDGQWIVTSHSNDTYDLYRLRVDGTETLHLLTLPERFNFQAWSSDSEWFYFSMGYENGADIYRLNIFTAQLEQLTDSEDVDFFQWLSPDGRWLYYVSKPFDEPRHEVFILDLEDHSRRSLGVYSTGINIQLMSQDGDWVYFQRRFDDNRAGLFRMHIDGTDIHAIIEMPDYMSIIGWSSLERTDLDLALLVAISLLIVACGGLFAGLIRRL